MAQIIEVYNPIENPEFDNSFGFDDKNQFVRTGILSVPFVDFKKYKEKDNYDIYVDIGYFPPVTKSKVLAAKITEKSRFKWQGDFYKIVIFVPVVGQIYNIEFKKILQNDGVITGNV